MSFNWMGLVFLLPPKLAHEQQTDSSLEMETYGRFVTPLDSRWSSSAELWKSVSGNLSLEMWNLCTLGQNS